jgi:curved DNA-binding protein CbpA
MAAASHDPYETLGVSPSATDAELRAAYHRLVQLHHPDHNHGSPEAATRFEQIQDAYARVRGQHARTPPAERASPRAAADPDVEARIADIERGLREAQAARERARRAAAEAAAATDERPSDEELGYVDSEDSFSKVLDDALAELWERIRPPRGE